MKHLSLFIFLLATCSVRSQVCFNSIMPANVTTVGTNPMSLCSADFNGDGKKDVAVANNSGGVSVLLGTGTGLFSTPTIYVASNGPWGICSADFNHDGNPDLAVTGSLSNDVAILMGSSSGTFANAVTYAVGGSPGFIASSDFNSDGNPDLAFIKGNMLSILLGSASGTFGTNQDYVAGTSAYALCVADFNSDGNKDVAVANNAASGAVTVLFGSTTGTFALSASYTVNSNACAINTADFNHDGSPDICVTNSNLSSGSYLGILLGSGAGTLSAVVNYSAGNQAYSVLPVDMNGDGNFDIITSRVSGKTISVFAGTGSGSFLNPVSFIAPDPPGYLIADDFNSDGFYDIVNSSYFSTPRINIILGSPSSLLASANSCSVGNSPYFNRIADFNNDGKPDVATANMLSDNVSVMIGLGNATFASPVNYSVGTRPYALVTSDFNNDGKPDLAVCNYSSNNVSLLLGSASGTFGALTNFTVGTNPSGIQVADFNNDGNKDLVTSNIGSADVSILMGNGSGGFAAAVTYTMAGGITNVGVADLNGDGYKDIATSSVSGLICVLLGSSSGTFSYGSTSNSIGSAYYLDFADFNNDGKLDVLVPNAISSSVTVRFGTGSGTFTGSINYAVGGGPNYVLAGDFNMDGNADIVSSNLGSSNISVLAGDGSGGFGPVSTFFTGLSPRGISSGDFNTDGKPDLAVASSGINQLNVLLNGTPSLSLTSTNTVCLGNSINVTASGANTYSWSNGFTGNPGVLTPSSNTTYTVVGLSFGGCTATAVKSITVSVLPLPTIAVSNGTICRGQSFTISPTGANTYTINGNTSFTAGGSAIYTPTANSTYSVIGTNTTNGCRSSVTTASITVNPLPTITVNSGSICAGHSFSIVANGTSSYNYPGGSALVSPIATTAYPVTGTDANGCVSMPAMASVTVSPIPTISVNSGAICLGKSFTMTLMGALNYTVSGGNGVVTPTANTSYTVMGTSPAGCVSTLAAISNVTVNPLPVISINGNNSICKGSAISLIANGSSSTYTWNTGSNSSLLVTTPTTTTIYTVQGVNSFNCVGSASKTITVNNLPQVTAIASNTLVCEGATVVLNGIGASTYTWSGGVSNGIPFSVSSNTTYVVSGTDVNNCTNSTSVVINTLPAPYLNAYFLTVNAGSVFCAGEPLLLMAVGHDCSFLWSTGDTISEPVAYPMVSSVYTVTATSDINGCSKEATVSITVDPCTGLADLNGQTAGILVYPNPGNGDFTLENNTAISVRIFSCVGQFILKTELPEGNHKIDLSNYANGIYIMELNQNGSQKIIKLVKQ